MYLSVPLIIILIVVLWSLLSRIGKYKAALSQLYTALEIVNQATQFTTQAQRIAEALEDEGNTPPVSLAEATRFTQSFLAHAEPFTSSTGISVNYAQDYYQKYSGSMDEQKQYTNKYARAVLQGLSKVTQD